MTSAALKAMEYDTAPGLPGVVVKILKAGGYLNQVRRKSVGFFHPRFFIHAFYLSNRLKCMFV